MTELFLTEEAKHFLQRMKAEALPEQKYFRLGSSSQAFLTDEQSSFGSALARHGASDKELLEAGKKYYEEIKPAVVWKFVPDLLSEKEVAGFETLAIGEFSFCMPLTMFNALSGYCIDADKDELLLRKV